MKLKTDWKLTKKQLTCKHEWKNDFEDDVGTDYRCIKCNLTKWEASY